MVTTDPKKVNRFLYLMNANVLIRLLINYMFRISNRFYVGQKLRYPNYKKHSKIKNKKNEIWILPNMF